MNIDNINKGIQYVSVKDMNLDQLVSFVKSQYKTDYFWEWILVRSKPEFIRFIRGLFYKSVDFTKNLSNISLNKTEYELSDVIKLLISAHPDAYPFDSNEYLSDTVLLLWIKEQEASYRRISIPESYLCQKPQNLYGCVIKFFPVLDRIVYQVVEECLISNTEVIKTHRLTTKEYKNIVDKKEEELLKAKEFSDVCERQAASFMKLEQRIYERLKKPGTDEFYRVRELKRHPIHITFFNRFQEVIGTSEGIIKNIKSFCLSKPAYNEPEKGFIPAYRIVMFLDGIQFHENNVNALIDIQPLEVSNNELDITQGWKVSLYETEQYQFIDKQITNLKEPLDGISCVIKLLEN